MASAFLLPLLLGAGTGIGSWLLNKIPGLGPSAQNVNPESEFSKNPIYQMLFGAGGQAAGAQANQAAMMGGMGQSLGDMQSFLRNAVSTSQAYDPNAFWKDFMAAQPEMQALISGPTGSFKSAAESNLSDFVKQATAETGQEMSQMGSLYSGAMGSITGTKIGQEAKKAGTDLASLQAGLMSQMWGSALPQFSAGRQFQTSNLVNTYLQGGQMNLGAAGVYQGAAGMYGNQLMQMLGIGADLSSPVYVQQPGIGDALMQGLGFGLQGGAVMGMLPQKKTPTTPTVDPNILRMLFGDR
jgi:hypothetical protein